MKSPFIQIDLGEHDTYRAPYDPAGFASSEEDFKEYLRTHEKESNVELIKGKENKFPFCCNFHKFIYDDVNTGFDSFPRPNDEKYLLNPWFKKKNYESLPQKITALILLTQHHIELRIDASDWYSDITEYIEYMVGSFGYPAVFCDHYLHFLKFLLQNLDGTEKQKEGYKKLTEYVEDNYYTVKEKIEPLDLNSLYSTYQIWLAAFPFNISFFAELKKKFEKGFLSIVLNKHRLNRYTGVTSSKARTHTELIEVLTESTKTLLIDIDTVNLLENGLIDDTKKLTLEIKKKELQIKNDLLLRKFSKGELEYLNILKEWLSYQKDFFRDISVFISDNVEKKSNEQSVEQVNSTLLKTEFEKLGFMNLPLIKGTFSIANIESLFELLSTKKAPYLVEMLHYIGFLDHMYRNNSKEHCYHIIAKVLKAKPRVIKGNCLVLTQKSVERRDTYTSHLHIEQVKKDYEMIKMG